MRKIIIALASTAALAVSSCGQALAGSIKPPSGDIERDVAAAASLAAVCDDQMSLMVSVMLSARQAGVGQYRVQELVEFGTEDGLRLVSEAQAKFGDDFATKMDETCKRIAAELKYGER